jgi:hypothetical protein
MQEVLKVIFDLRQEDFESTKELIRICKSKKDSGGISRRDLSSIVNGEDVKM